ncbi:uncharacterized protein [Macrobrachium rosenbergii]|uniref:uncharacterized protein n=1 Tax=Macrobrachium rosenbergii TaxID=79674 RepID=UPI0034D4CD00
MCQRGEPSQEGSALSPFLLVLVIDMLSEEIRNEVLWELLYSDDLLITAEDKEDLQRRDGEWQESLERGCLRVNKTEALVSSREDRDRIVIQERRGSITKQMEKFKCFAPTLSQEGGCEAKVDIEYNGDDDILQNNAAQEWLSSHTSVIS